MTTPNLINLLTNLKDPATTGIKFVKFDTAQ